ncbi:MAG: cation transporter, partial [Phycisphaerae bacterium]|nr:cation transporter [Phycisphaerae bacterium]
MSLPSASRNEPNTHGAAGKHTAAADEPSTRVLLSGEGITIASITANAALALAKITAGLTCSSQTILADGLHSSSDLVTDAAVLAGLRVSKKPADVSHPYGHRRVGTLVAMLIGAFLLVAAASIVTGAMKTLRDPTDRMSPTFPFWLAVASVPVKELLFQLTRWVGRRTSNLSLLANAWHHRTDAFTSIAAAAGLGGVLIGGADWFFLDALTAVLLAAFLVVVAVRIISSSASELIDKAPDEKTLERIKSAVSKTDGVRSYHAFRARNVGGKIAA